MCIRDSSWLAQESASWPVSAFDINTPCTFPDLEAVSYTHLDVYKRQVQSLENLVGLNLSTCVMFLNDFSSGQMVIVPTFCTSIYPWYRPSMVSEKRLKILARYPLIHPRSEVETMRCEVLGSMYVGKVSANSSLSLIHI